MKNISGKAKIFLIVVFLVSFIMSLSLFWTPQVSYSCDIDTFEPVLTLDYDDVDVLNQCEINEQGYVSISGEDPYIIFSDLMDTERVVNIKFKEPISEKTEIELFMDYGKGFTEAQKIEYQCAKGENGACIVLSDAPYSKIRLDIDVPYTLESLDIGSAVVTEKNVQELPKNIARAILASMIATLCWFGIDLKWKVSDKIWAYFLSVKQSMLKGIVYILGIGIISVLITVILRGVPALDMYQTYAFFVSAMFVFSTLCAIACVWCNRKKLVQNFEKIFVTLLLLVGFTMIVATPFAHASWDTESHYLWSLEASYLGRTQITRSDMMIATVAPDSLIKEDPNANFMNMSILSEGYDEVIWWQAGEVSIPHMPSGLFLALGRLIGLPYVLLFMFGKIPNLLLYATLCYFALKRLKTGKLVLAVIALFPTNVFLACNYSYDYWVTGFSILGMAYFIGVLQNEDKSVTIKETAIMCAAFGMACIPKLIYFPLLLIPFFMSGKKIENKKKYYTACSAILAVVLSSFILSYLAQSTAPGDMRGGSTVNPSEQLAYIFGDLFNYIGILWKFLFKEYLAVSNMKNYISNYAYLGVAEGSAILIVILLLVFLFDRDKAYTKQTETNWWLRIYALLMFFGGNAIIATALYVVFTPVAHETVLGCQARYMIPWIYPLLSVYTMNRIKPLIPPKVLYWAVTLGCFGILFFDIYTVFIPRIIVF